MLCMWVQMCTHAETGAAGVVWQPSPEKVRNEGPLRDCDVVFNYLAAGILETALPSWVGILPVLELPRGLHDHCPLTSFLSLEKKWAEKQSQLIWQQSQS